MDTSELYAKAAKLWGKELQMQLCQEECGELISVIGRVFRGRDISVDQVCEAVADAEIMLEQMKVFFPEERIRHWKEEKLARLEKRIALAEGRK